MEEIKRKRGRPRKNPLPVEILADLEEDEEIVCPKCKLDDPGDWTQCNGSCPMPESPFYVKKGKATLPLAINNTYALVGHDWKILSFTGEHFLKASRSPHGVIHGLARSDFENWIKNS